MSSDGPSAWERQPWETAAAWRAFEVYLAQPRPRTVTGAYRLDQLAKGKDPARVRALKGASGSWIAWAMGKDSSGRPIPDQVTMSWAQRGDLYDSHMAALLQEKKEAALIRYEDRILDLIVGGPDQRGTIDYLADMIALPITASVLDGEDGPQIYVPNGWRPRDVAALAVAMDKIMRLTAEVPTDRPEIATPGLNQAIRDLPDEVLNDRLEQLLTRLPGLIGQGGSGGPSNPFTGDSGSADKGRQGEDPGP